MSTPFPLVLPPGVVKTRSEEGRSGRWSDTQNVRFVNGKPQKRAGFTQLNTALLSGVARGFETWNNPTTGAPLYAVGTQNKLYGSTDGIEPTDITPFDIGMELSSGSVAVTEGSGFVRVTGMRAYRDIDGNRTYLSFTPTAGSSTLTAALVGLFSDQTFVLHDSAVGDKLLITQGTPIGGGTMGPGAFEIGALTANGFTFDMGFQSADAVAGQSLTGTYLLTGFSYFDTFQINTTKASTVVTGSYFMAHGMVPGDTFTFAASESVVGGITLSGTYTVLTVPSSTTWTFRDDEAATLTDSGSPGTIIRTSNIHAGSVYRLVDSSANGSVGGLNLDGDWVALTQESQEQTVVLAPKNSGTALGSNPITTAMPLSESSTLTTQSGQPTVTVNSTATAFAVGDVAVIPSTSVGGITVSGSYVVVSKSTNSYTVTHTSNAGSSATSGSITVTGYHVGSNGTVSVHWVAHGRIVDDVVGFSGATYFNGILLDGSFTVAAVTDADNFSVTVPLGPTAAGSGGGSAIVGYTPTPAASTVTASRSVPFEARLTNPFTTQSGQNTVTVAYPGHGRAVGDPILISGASAVGGITPNGSFTVASVPDIVSFTFHFTSSASSSTTGGGTPFVEFPLGGGHVDSLVGSYDASSWSISSIGEDAVMNRVGSAIFYWDSSSGDRAKLLGGAPTGLFVCQTEERITHVLGADGEPLTIAWSNRDTPNDFVVRETGQANSRKVASGSTLVSMAPFGNGLNFIWTDTTAFTHQFTGSAFVYQTLKAVNGDDAGIIGPHAFAKTPRGMFWMSQAAFKSWAGAVIDVPNQEDIRDWVFSRINTAQKVKCHAVYDAINDSIDFFYVITGQTEPTECVTVNLKDYSWINHTETRTTGATFNKGAQNPHKITTDGRIMKHETGLDAAGAAASSSLSFAALEFAKGAHSEIVGIDPDFKRQVGSVTFAYSSYDRNPNNTPADSGSITLTTTTELGDLRVEGRRISGTFSQSGVTGGDWAMDTPQVLVNSRGKRP